MDRVCIIIAYLAHNVRMKCAEEGRRYLPCVSYLLEKFLVASIVVKIAPWQQTIIGNRLIIARSRAQREDRELDREACIVYNRDRAVFYIYRGWGLMFKYTLGGFSSVRHNINLFLIVFILLLSSRAAAMYTSVSYTEEPNEAATDRTRASVILGI